MAVCPCLVQYCLQQRARDHPRERRSTIETLSQRGRLRHCKISSSASCTASAVFVALWCFRVVYQGVHACRSPAVLLVRDVLHPVEVSRRGRGELENVHPSAVGGRDGAEGRVAGEEDEVLWWKAV